jgi:hypothetical protein
MPTQEASLYIMMEDKNDKFYTKVEMIVPLKLDL